jgi:hypothetical protein
MSASTTLTRDTLPTTACARCQARILITVDRHGARKVLDAHRVPGGLFELDGRGRAARRPLTVIAAEVRAAHAGRLNVGRGFAVHECPKARTLRW